MTKEEKKIGYSFVMLQVLVYRKWEKPMDKNVMEAMMDRCFAFTKMAEQHHFNKYEFYVNLIWLADKLGYSKKSKEIYKSVKRLKDMGYISSREAFVDGKKREIYRINLEKIQEENIRFNLCEEDESYSEITAETEQTETEAVAETNTTQSDSEPKKKMKDISITPYECSSKERVKIAAENTEEPKRAMADTSIQRETYQEAKRTEYSLEGYSESMKNRLTNLLSQMDESIASVQQSKDDELSSKTNELALKVFKEPSNSIVQDIEDFLKSHKDNAQHLKDRIIYRMNNPTRIIYGTN